jgi:hypothetical protein
MKCALVKKTRRGKKLAGRKYCREKPGSLQQSVSEIVVVENNYLSSKQIGAWSAEMKSCQAGGGDCDGIIRKYEEQVPHSKRLTLFSHWSQARRLSPQQEIPKHTTRR